MIASKSAQSNLPHASGVPHNLENADDMSEIIFCGFFSVTSVQSFFFASN